jgi:hypothetical protein
LVERSPEYTFVLDKNSARPVLSKNSTRMQEFFAGLSASALGTPRPEGIRPQVQKMLESFSRLRSTEGEVSLCDLLSSNNLDFATKAEWFSAYLTPALDFLEKKDADDLARAQEQPVEKEMMEDRATLKRARSVFFLDKPRRRPLPILKKSADALSVTGCADREETILRLGFLAAEKGFNAVIRAEVFPKKIRNAGYQKMEWTGTGFPAVVDEERIEWQAD